MRHPVLSFLAAGLLLLSGCKKDADLVNCDLQPSKNTLATFTRTYGAPTQTFTFNASSSGVFTSSIGNQILVYPNSFVLPDGRALPVNTSIKIEFREIETKANMILSAMPTISNGQPLESAGEYYFKATAGNTRLRMSGNGRIYMQTANRPSSTRNNAMQLFFGQNTPNGFNWLPQSQQDSISGIRTSRDSVNTTGSYFNYFITLNNDSLGWINCDAFLNVNPNTPVSVAVNGQNVTADNTAIYLVFTNRNSVLSRGILTVTSTGAAVDFAAIPVGDAVSAIVIRHVDDKYYFGRQDGTVSAGQTFTPSLREVTEAELVAEIRRL